MREIDYLLGNSIFLISEKTQEYACRMIRDYPRARYLHSVLAAFARVTCAQ
jgi:hypothetical protein